MHFAISILRPLLALSCVLAPLAGVAQSKNTAATDPDALMTQAREAMLDYNVKGAQSALDKYAATKRGKDAEYRSISEALLNMRNMLDRVERVTIIDSMVVPRENFFGHYRMHPDVGNIIDGSALRQLLEEVADMPVFASNDRQTLIWSVADSADVHHLREGGVLLDGTVDVPQPIELGLDPTGSLDYPWLMQDGTTLYFAYDGPGSIGGYDIYMTRRNPEGGWYEPQNMGMPYNSPADDIMYAVDEETGIGWWATDRMAPTDSLTIYMFQPREVRENYATDTPGLAELARIWSIADTQADSAATATLRAAIAAIPSMKAEGAQAETSPEYLDYKEAQDKMSTTLRHLALLRREYAKGNTQTASSITEIEDSLPDLREELKQKRNAYIQSQR